MKARCSLPQFLKDWALRVSQAGEKRTHILALASRSEVLQNAPIMLCTIASTRLLLKQWEESFTIVEPILASCREMGEVHLSVREPLQMHTIIGAILKVNLGLSLQ
jgi:hypothetical protein